MSSIEYEPLWGAPPLSVTAVGSRWGIGRVIPVETAELSPNPRWGIWDLKSGRLVFGPSGALAIAISSDEKQIAVWRETLAEVTGQPFFGGKARTDFRWSFERRRWPKHDKLLSTTTELRPELIRSWPISIEYAPDDSYVTLTCRSEQRTDQIFIECAAKGPDRILDAEPVKPRPKKADAAPKPKPRAKKTKAKAKAKAKPRTKPTPKTRRKGKPKKPVKSGPRRTSKTKKSTKKKARARR